MITFNFDYDRSRFHINIYKKKSRVQNTHPSILSANDKLCDNRGQFMAKKYPQS